MIILIMFSSAASSQASHIYFLPLLACALVGAGALYVICIYRVHPLSRVPSIHWSAPLSSCYALYLLYAGFRRVVLYDVHTGRQGRSQSLPVLRVGPNEESIMSSEGIRLAFGGGFERSSWYEVFENFRQVGFSAVLDGCITLGLAD